MGALTNLTDRTVSDGVVIQWEDCFVVSGFLSCKVAKSRKEFFPLSLSDQPECKVATRKVADDAGGDHP